jgi:hypothetical protein
MRCTSQEKARNFLRCLPQVRTVLENTSRPFIAKVYQPNRDDPDDSKTRRIEVKLTYNVWAARRRQSGLLP